MHELEAGAVPTRVLRNEATLPLMFAGVRELVKSFGCPFTELAFACTLSSPELSNNVIQLNAQFCTHGGYLHALTNTLTSRCYRLKRCNIFYI